MLLGVVSGFYTAPQNNEKGFSLVLERRRKRRRGLAHAQGQALDMRVWSQLELGYASFGCCYFLVFPHKEEMPFTEHLFRIKQLVSWWWIAV